jgi:hypothetical protein
VRPGGSLDITATHGGESYTASGVAVAFGDSIVVYRDRENVQVQTLAGVVANGVSINVVMVGAIAADFLTMDQDGLFLPTGRIELSGGTQTNGAEGTPINSSIGNGVLVTLNSLLDVSTSAMVEATDVQIFNGDSIAVKTTGVEIYPNALVSGAKVSVVFDIVTTVFRSIRETGEFLDGDISVTGAAASNGFQPSPVTLVVENAKQVNATALMVFGSSNVQFAGNVAVNRGDSITVSPQGSTVFPGVAGNDAVVSMIFDLVDVEITAVDTFGVLEPNARVQVSGSATTNGFKGTPVSVTMPDGGQINIDGLHIVTNLQYTISGIQVDEGDSIFVSPAGIQQTAGVVTGGAKIVIEVPENNPPVASAGADSTYSCSAAGMYVALDGSGTTDVDGDALTYTWREGATVLATGLAAVAEKPVVLLSVGVHNITLTVDDGKGGVATDDVVITIGDVLAPAVTITSHTDGQWVSKKNNHIEGTIVEAVDVLSVKVNGHGGGASGNAPDFTFRGPTGALQPDGPHAVTVVAKDLAGNEGTASITLNLDTEGPVVTIDTPANDDVLTSNPSVVTVTGQVSDAGSGVSTVAVNGEAATINGGGYTADVTIQGNGSRRVRVVATDVVGHTTTVTIHVTIDTLPPRVTISSPATKAVVGQNVFIVTGRALDSGRGVQSVFVQFDSDTPVAATLDTEADTYSATFDFSQSTPPNGEYTLKATASDGVYEATAETTINLSIGGNDPVLTFAVLDDLGIGLAGVRVDLLKDTGSSAGQRQNTDGNGQVAFLVDPAKSYRFKVYYRGGTWTSSTPVGTSDPMTDLNTELSVLTLNDSVPAGIEGARVDLLRGNNSNTGVRLNTDGSGDAGFQVLPGFEHKFKVYYNGGTEVTALVIGGADIGIQTARSELTLTTHLGGLIDGARVDLLRSNDSSTGIRENTSSGVSGFEVLPGFVHRFKVYYNGGAYITGDLTGGAGTTVATELSSLSLTNSGGGGGIEGVRVDLLRANGSNTGVRVGTDSSGDAPFQVLPGFAHSFKIYHNGGTAITPERTAGGTSPVSTVASDFTLTDSSGSPIEGARVDLLRSNRSNTGVRTSTNSSGVAVFEVLEGYKHRFKVYYNGGDFTTEEVSF